MARVPEGVEYNHSYFPVVLHNEQELEHVRKTLNDLNVFPRRYFRPACTQLPFVNKAGECPISERLAGSVLCLPMYHGLEDDTIAAIANSILASI